MTTTRIAGPIVGLAVFVFHTGCGSSTSSGGDSAPQTNRDAQITDGSAPDAGEWHPDATSSDSGEPSDAGAEDSGLTIGDPIVAPAKQWTWVDFPDSFCDDGTTTGIGVNTSTTTSNVLIFLNGGGACWDYQTCIQLVTATRGPFGRAEFDALSAFIDVGAFDRTNAANVFRDWSFVFVPYCTGDVHGGDNLATYVSPGGDMFPYNHVGHANVIAFLSRLVATFPATPKLVLSGSSAGGYGALFNYPTFRTHWPVGQMYLIDDSGPPLIGDAIPDELRAAWFSSWRIDLLLDPLCGEPCRTNFAAGLTALSLRYPNDRLALLSSLQDRVIRGYVLQTAPGFETELVRVATDVLDPTSNFKYFYIPGEGHTMLGNPAGAQSNGTNLFTWLRQMIEDDPNWASTKP